MANEKFKIQKISSNKTSPIVSNLQVNGANDLLSNFDRCSNAGLQIGEFFRLAEQNPEVALGAVAEILKSHNRIEVRALALRSIGKIGHRPTLKEITACQSESSKDLLKLLLSSLQGKGDIDRDLIRWAASDALENIGYSPAFLHHSDFDGLVESQQLIIQEIVDRNIGLIDRVVRLNSRGVQTSDYQRFLKFWIYGPTTEIFKEKSRSNNYRAIVEDILVELQSLGVILGLGLKGSYEPSGVAQDASICLAKQIYKQSNDNEKILYEHLDSYLHDNKHEISLRITAIELINSTNSWKPTQERLHTLIKCLLYREELRNAVVRLFKFQRESIQQANTDAAMLLKALSFSYNLAQPDPMNMNLSTIDNHTSLANSYRQTIQSIFDLALSASRRISSQYSYSDAVIVQFLTNQKNSHMIKIDAWIGKLSQQHDTTMRKYQDIEFNQQKLSKYITLAKNIYSTLNSNFINPLDNIRPILLTTNIFSYNQYMEINTEANILKDRFIEQLKICVNYLSSQTSSILKSVKLFTTTGIISLVLTLWRINLLVNIDIFLIICIFGLVLSIGIVVYGFKLIPKLNKTSKVLGDILQNIPREWRY
jgi:hypothetical protein